MTYSEIINYLQSQRNEKNIVGMARFGISSKNSLGISIPTLRRLAKKIGTDHTLAQKLWDTEIHEARHLTGMIADSDKLTVKQMDTWVADLDSWDVCDGMCMNCFYQSPRARLRAKVWATSEKEFIRRAGFAMMAVLAFKSRDTTDKDLLSYFPLIKQYSTDERNFVRKAVNWALRQIGKRNKNLQRHAILLAKELKKSKNKTAHWIGSDALRELQSKHLKK